MKIAFVVGNVFKTFGGAAIASLVFLKKLERDFNHRCLLLTHHPCPRREIVSGIETAGYRDPAELQDAIRLFQPDVMLGALKDATHAIRVANRFRIPGFVYHHSYEYCEPTPEEKADWGLPSNFAFPSLEEADFVHGSSAGIFACSRHMQRALQEKHRRASDVLYCDFDPVEVLLDSRSRRRDYVTGICGYGHKGLEIFLRLAGEFPRQRFLLAGDLGSDIDPSYRREFEALPNLALPGRLSTKELLGRSKLVLVPSLWPEPFGRIAVEAMANGIPILASYTGGLREILGDAPMAVKPFRDREAWVDRLKALMDSAELRSFYAAQGKARAQPFLERNSTFELEARLRTACDKQKPDFSGRSMIAFYGDMNRPESDSLVNSRWSEALTAKRSFVPCFHASGFDLPDFTVHHDYTRHFTEFVPPESGACIAVRTSDFGPYPPAWAAKINAEFDQLWVHTEWIREQAIASGIDPARVRVVPLGVAPAIFRPDGPVYPLSTKKSFRFLFVGTAVVRKGFDILLKAYRQAFTREDDVSLVVKDHSANTFHSATYREEIEAMVRDEKAPEILYLDEFLPVEQLAALYRACDAAVFPYRAEGFCLPILEAMACGTPSIVPNLGPAVDFCSEKTSFLIPALRIKLPVNRRFALKIGVEEEIAAVDFCEVRVESLTRALKEVGALAKGQLESKATEGVRLAHNRFTWEHSADRVADLLQEISQAGVPVRLQNSRREAEKAYKKFEAARRLLAVDIARRASARNENFQF
jgi:glycosyltransferase involved in cell wall biosynthesis